jgi:hypothetical protein
MASVTVPDFTYFSVEEKQALLSAIKAEMLRRAGLGSISSGASQGQSTTMTKLSEESLAAWANALSAELNGEPITQVRPIFING